MPMPVSLCPCAIFCLCLKLFLPTHLQTNFQCTEAALCFTVLRPEHLAGVLASKRKQHPTLTKPPSVYIARRTAFTSSMPTFLHTQRRNLKKHNT
ncbi:hypothetical protein H4582DRAFT_1380812 [Lactarius indigo]|nr:hypothetical protein H4582DRAFT_304913 [Lactarius indigo]KAI9441416.1 hypothetical protein H4582DRAFT_1380812 [Lactarius indigo]